MGRIMSETSTPLPFSNFTVDTKATATTPAAPHNLTSQEFAEAVRKSDFNPTLAVVVFVMIISFFVVGFASVYLRRWIWGAEALEREAILRHRRPPLRPLSQSLKPQRGLDPEIVGALPLVLYKDLPADERAGKYFDCPVCLAVFDATDSLRLLPQCSHAFHSDCIDEWFRSHTTCPLCRVCLSHPVGKSARREGRGDGDVERGGMRVPADFDVVDVVIRSGATAISGYESQAGIPTVGAPTENTTAEEEEQDLQVNPRPVICSNAGGCLSFMPATRVDIAPAKAALASIRRSNSVGTDLQLRHAGYVVDSEGTQHNRNFQFYAIANINDQDGNGSSTSRPVSLGDYWGGGVFSVASGGISSKVGLQSVWSARRSSPNLRQTAPV